MKTFVPGFPRMGLHRELKFAMESFWKGTASASELLQLAKELRLRHWNIQKEAGLSTVATGDFSFYDHVLDTAVMFGLIPERFSDLSFDSPETRLTSYYKLARGDQQKGIPAMEMTKWFNTNYHYIVPEICEKTQPKLSCLDIINQTQEALDAGYTPRPVLVGPITLLALSKSVSEEPYDIWNQLWPLVALYEKVLAELGTLCEWIQIDEPILCSDIPEAGKQNFQAVYQRLIAAAGNGKLLLTTYFDALDENRDLALSSGCAGIHLDLVRGASALDAILDAIPDSMVLSAGVVEGRNIWKNDFQKSLDTLNKIKGKLGEDRMMVAASCSLLHSPVDLSEETALDETLKSWMSFAVQKCSEVQILADLLSGKPREAEFEANQKAIHSRRESTRVHNPEVSARMAGISEDAFHRAHAYPIRKQAQADLNLPLFPTTTIGSFPQTDAIRKTRMAFRKKNISEQEYTEFMQNEIRMVVSRQEELGLDVLVHGEPERNDMVEYFGQQLSGFCFTQNGWVQSYGSRCVKPPVIFGDVSRPRPMTVEWSRFAQSLTNKPMKGMLTGPITILCWSFVRDDMERSEVAKQIALAMRDEVSDLEKAGIRIIQIDEAALSEGMPVKTRDHEAYLKWAVEAFRLTMACVQDSTQIHTHMCYSEFNKIITAIAAMDADVISIESSRSRMELLDCFVQYEYPNEIGPGVYDIHSPRIPSQEEMVGLLRIAASVIPKERLWVNPDCGLKTRHWEEVIPSLTNMVAAAKQIREEA
ncbi:MAG: 5-methyltetrahydropteroyltriglutamate--homocysteine S-methyltransferase [Planctomycetia bacterium]|nr:5-methyltetrahydropteroyltriglutamate--homocysteine S-methyltransferase [Planctomycetia bacterium]